MTYDQADNILRDQPPDEPGKAPPPPLTAGSPIDPTLIPSLKKDLIILTRLARLLKKHREEVGGAVDLSSGDTGSELKFTLVNGQPVKVIPKQEKEIHHTIEELMIMANTAVASKIYDIFPDSALLRVHRPVEEDRLSELKEALSASGVFLHGSSNAELAKALKKAEEKNRSKNVVNALYKSLATRAMTEAAYICSGDSDNASEFGHYGLGVEKYTHFTSPIRRYADVVVHKQLLAALFVESQPPPTRAAPLPTIPAIAPLEAMPSSQAVSILGGEGLQKTNVQDHDDIDNEDGFLDALIHGASELVLGFESEGKLEEEGLPTISTATRAETGCNSRTLIDISSEPYTTTDVSFICQGLNLHNRLAKRSSQECQALFLSLYFNENVEVTQAVVLQLRINGFWVYVPRFDMKGPVYVRDVHGAVQIDPSLVGLDPDAGLPATMGFAHSEYNCRRFSDGMCILIDPPYERLEVSVPHGKKSYIVHPLDVITVRVSCDDWDVRARVPFPRLQLVSDQYFIPSTNKTESRLMITSDVVQGRVSNNEVSLALEAKTSEMTESIYDYLSSIPLYPVLTNVPFRCSLRSANTNKPLNGEPYPMLRSSTMKGRWNYGDFVNPQATTAAAALMAATAHDGRTPRLSSTLSASQIQNDYDRVRQVERNVTLRQQRLMAEKRSTRRSKAK